MLFRSMHAQKVLIGKRIGSHGASKCAICNCSHIHPLIFFLGEVTFCGQRLAILITTSFLCHFLLFRHLAVGWRYGKQQIIARTICVAKQLNTYKQSAHILLYSFPVGHLEFGEDFEECAIRKSLSHSTSPTPLAQ